MRLSLSLGCKMEMHSLLRKVILVHLWLWCAVVSLIRLENISSNQVNKSRIKSCRIFNWSSMTCYWDRYFIDSQEVTFSLEYIKGNVKENWKKCVKFEKNESVNMCHFLQTRNADSFYFVPYTLYLKSSHPSLIADSDEIHMNISDLGRIVEPSPVSVSLVNITSTSISLGWNGPHKSHSLLYNVTSIFRGKSDWKTTDYKNITYTGLSPNSFYQITITCIEKFGNGTRGFWSQPMMFDFTTKESVPGAAPFIFPGGFTFHPNNMVNIMWLSLTSSTSNGIINSTRLKITSTTLPHNSSSEDGCDVTESYRMNNLGDVIIFHGRINEAHLELDATKCHVVYVDQGTNIGFNDSLILQPVLIPARNKTIQNIIVLNATVDENTFFEFVWVPTSENVTFYWCQINFKSTCISSYEYEVVSGGSGNFRKTLSPLNGHRWKFASSVEHWRNNRILSSGMKIIDCIFDLSKSHLSPPTSFYHESYKHNEVILKWTSPDCLGEYPPYFNHYLISYCPVRQCQDPVTKMISKEDNIATITQLISGKKYNFSIRRSSLDGERISPPSQILLIHIPENSIINWNWIEFVLPIAVLLFVALAISLAYGIIHLKKYQQPIKIEIPQCKQHALSIGSGLTYCSTI